jgi:hypothetical protein
MVETDQVDPGELDAEPASATHAAACYIDLLPRGEQQWQLPALAADWCKELCGRLHPLPLRCCRADLVIRRAFIAPDLDRLGVTAYLTACGASPAETGQVLEIALAAFAGVFKDQL